MIEEEEENKIRNPLKCNLKSCEILMKLIEDYTLFVNNKFTLNIEELDL